MLGKKSDPVKKQMSLELAVKKRKFIEKLKANKAKKQKEGVK